MQCFRFFSSEKFDFDFDENHAWAVSTILSER